MAMTSEQIAQRIAALLEEKAGYIARGLEDRAWQVELELRRLGAGGRPPHARATKR